ncbi:uncharacterized protein CLUP02_14846 [Colletotrichum lupini]|uniref:Uncharacterized protein n=1 Tax=Colletotrichum lupini TaxID=145971 RepID=A0A9Q8WNG1_9PEZI|nr:uncharacterized protein CLUP02_14846 [Colletotrichum lupini]UQC89317.1 hypothetical protein CLUP02_14846 [Colletotrichum lupini]
MACRVTLRLCIFRTIITNSTAAGSAASPELIRNAPLILPHYDIAMLMANSLLSVIIRNALNQFYCHFSLSYTASPNWPGCPIPQLTPALKVVSPTPA